LFLTDLNEQDIRKGNRMQENEKLGLPEKIKDDVRQKFGRDIRYTKDCRILAEQIFEITSRRLSISTIKRFFGLVHSPFQPSKFTLETLAVFMGFENLKEYINDHNKKSESGFGSDLQEIIKINAKIITEKSLNSFTRKTDYNPGKFLSRDFANKHINAFLKSGKTATMLIAPAGFGKSSTLLQWFGGFTPETGSRFEHDTICVIDGGIFFTFYNLTHNIKIVNQLIDFDENIKYGPDEEEKKGRYIVVIDDVDEIFSRKEKYYNLAENIMRIVMMNNENRHFKLILTCRPENIDPFTSLIKYNPLLANSWFNIDFFRQNHSEFINVPLMSRAELQTALNRSECHLTFHFFTFCQHELLRVINLPSYFSYFTNENDNSPLSFSEKIVLNNLVQHIIYSPPFAEEKQLLVKTFFRLCNPEEDADFVNKEKLLEETECHLAYRELLKSGLIYESIDMDVFKVGFSNQVLYEFLLFKYILQGRELSIALFEELFYRFKTKPPMQNAVIKWFVKFAFSENNTALLQQLHHFMEHQEKMPQKTTKSSVSDSRRIYQITFSECLRLHKESCKILLPWLAESALGRKMYFEDCFDMDNLMFFPDQSLEVFESQTNTADDLIFVHFTRFIKGFYNLDYKKCTLEYDRIKKMNISKFQNPLSAAYYFTSQILHSSFCENKKDTHILRKILRFADELRKTKGQEASSVPGFEFFIIYNLNTCNLFSEVLSFSDYIENHNDFSGSESDCFYQHYNLCKARALLHTKHESEALQIYRQYKAGVFPHYQQHFMQMNADIIRADFLLHQHKKAELLNLLKEVNSLAGFLGFRFFVQQASAMEVKIKKPAKNGSF
jgi:hypothetical protein